MSNEEGWDCISEHQLVAGDASAGTTTTASSAAPAASPSAAPPSTAVYLPPPPPAPLPQQPKLLSQLDVIVMDISGSMKSKTTYDPLQTREDMSKVVFHAFVDKMMCFEVQHGVALIAFASDVKLTLPIIEQYERFHDELGRLDATGGSTRLFDALKYAGEVLVSYYQQQKGITVHPDARLRVFALTDGEDNASVAKHVEVAEWLRENRVVVDAYPMACRSEQLTEICTMTGGLSINVASLIEGLALFESEMMIHLDDRPSDLVGRFPHKDVLPLPTAVSHAALAQSSKPQVQNATLTTADLQQQTVCLPQTVQQRSMRAVVCRKVVDIDEWFEETFTAGMTPAIKRVKKELIALAGGEGGTSFASFLGKSVDAVTSIDHLHAKFLLPGPKGTPYEGGEFVLNVTWPTDYPFKPPAVRFLTPIYHCNISQAGQICLDILKNCWSPALTIHKILMSLEALLDEPNAWDALDGTKAMVYRNSKTEYELMAKAWTAQHASDHTALLASNQMEE